MRSWLIFSTNKQQDSKLELQEGDFQHRTTIGDPYYNTITMMRLLTNC